MNRARGEVWRDTEPMAVGALVGGGDDDVAGQLTRHLIEAPAVWVAVLSDEGNLIAGAGASRADAACLIAAVGAAFLADESFMRSLGSGMEGGKTMDGAGMSAHVCRIGAGDCLLLTLFDARARSETVSALAVERARGMERAVELVRGGPLLRLKL